MKKIYLIFTALYSINAFAYYTETMTNKCGLIPDNELHAVFTLNQYTCENGKFLPAYSDVCVSCPPDYTCSGGTFSFNENSFQGAVKSQTYITHGLTNMCSRNIPYGYYAVFTVNSYTCAPGYYLPADTDECVICPQNNLCVGGTYTFNETTNQGIEQCPNGTPFAPASSSSVCYPHVLHVGDDMVYLSATKRTTPSLNVEVNGTVFYANITAAPTYMSANSTHYFKTIVNDMEHYICDDTSYTE